MKTGLFFLAVLAISLAGKAQGARVLLVSVPPDHPPMTHLYAKGCAMLAGCLGQTPGVEAVVSMGWPKDPAKLEGVTAVVLYTSPGGSIVLNEANRAAFDDLIKKGAGYTAIHWATDADQKLGQDYLAVLGGWWSFIWGALEVRETRVSRGDPGHPVSRGWKDFTVTDEIYLRAVLMNSARPLAKAEVTGGEQVVAWTYERPGGGRSFGTTLGHFWVNFGNDDFRRMLVNGILWTAKVEVPESGAPVTINPDDMKVAEEPAKP